MTTDGGGWTLVFVASSANLSAVPIQYTTPSARLLQDASTALIAYRNSSSGIIAGRATFTLPGDWKNQPPFNFPGDDMDLSVSVDGAAATTAKLRYGKGNFSSLCTDPWTTTTSFGRVCIEGTKAPFFDGFVDTLADNCNTSLVSWNTTACSTERTFTIAVR